jgi:hypothetical protein
MRNAFKGDVTVAKQEIAAQVSKKLEAQALKEASRHRTEEIRNFVKSRGLMKDPRVKRFLDRLPEKPSALQISDVATDIRSLVVSDLLEEESAGKFEGTTVFRDVKILEELPGLTNDDFKQMEPSAKQGLTQRPDGNGTLRAYRVVTDLDAILVEEPVNGGKARISRIEQHKTGKNDTPSDARSQNSTALGAIERAQASGHSLRLELGDGTDVTSRIDIVTAHDATKVTIGPAEKGFDESLGITSADLERLVKELIKNSLSGDAQ